MLADKGSSHFGSDIGRKVVRETGGSCLAIRSNRVAENLIALETPHPYRTYKVNRLMRADEEVEVTIKAIKND